MTEKDLTRKQYQFCIEYLEDLNAAAAARRAGYAMATAKRASRDLLGNPAVKAEIERLQKARAEYVGVNKDFVLEELIRNYKILMNDVKPVYGNSGKPIKDKDARYILRRDNANILRCLELIGKHIDINSFRENISFNSEEDLIKRLNKGLAQAGEGSNVVPIGKKRN